MGMLNKLYSDYINDLELYKGNDESPGTLRTFDACVNSLQSIPKSLQSDVRDNIGGYGTEREELGFINGFRHAVQIMAECINTKQ